MNSNQKGMKFTEKTKNLRRADIALIVLWCGSRFDWCADDCGKGDGDDSVVCSSDRSISGSSIGRLGPPTSEPPPALYSTAHKTNSNRLRQRQQQLQQQRQQQRQQQQQGIPSIPTTTPQESPKTTTMPLTALSLTQPSPNNILNV